ncbi:hypothetical protein [Spiroplasma endosymbiont of Phyllotreta cruciferae]|uniref:hypothetical protein n=1 Tax=Spiroplasma endosymbiont of Phyllotreta cruciferae TaxID=2886375 RepID=UPI0020A01F3A|nr:hypothetical protein [Spiroplasma endosymbiont of Phyllotreta cruciferae]
MQFSTNKETTQAYFTNWINQKRSGLEQSVKKISGYDSTFTFMIPDFPVPTTLIEKNNLNLEIEKLEKELNEIAKVKYKQLLQTIEETTFPVKTTAINNNPTAEEIIINDKKITLELVRNKLNKYLQEYQNTLIIFVNATLKYGFISFTKKIKLTLILIISCKQIRNTLKLLVVEPHSLLVLHIKMKLIHF